MVINVFTNRIFTISFDAMIRFFTHIQRYEQRILFLRTRHENNGTLLWPKVAQKTIE